MDITGPPSLHSVGVNSKLDPGIRTELRLVLFSFGRDELIPIISNINLCLDIRVIVRYSEFFYVETKGR